jgi:subtilase family serine protease
MNRIAPGVLFSALLVLAFGANAQSVEKSGEVYYKTVCGRVVGLKARCDALVVTDRLGKAIGHDGESIAGYTPSDLRDAYKITADGISSTIVATVDAFGYDNAESDLAVYRAQFGLPPCTTANGCFRKFNQKGRQKKYPPQNIGWAEQSALDLDMASAMCPNCQIWLVESNTNSLKSLASAVDTAARLGAHVIANSYGADSNVPRHIQLSYRHPGIAITASSSESGRGSQFPASSPYVTAVGGTHLVRDNSARGWSETSFGYGSCTIDRKPKWQTDTGCAKRTIADVAAVADPATGVAVYGPNGSGVSTWLEFGGTSVAAPIIGGVYGANGGTVKYGSDPYAHTDALFDIVSGPGGDCDPEYLCNAGPGYDGPTGLGTPNGTAAFGED